jgi:5-methyltetrahydrofolate--homocysteine methyltransferase
MVRVSLSERIKEGLFLLDGAMGTQLITRGIEAGKCNDYVNIESPDTVLAVHKAYLEAGSDAILTNTFGANEFALGRHGLSKEVVKINKAGSEIARRAASEEKYVLGDIGPSGDFLKPLGNLEAEDLKKAFVAQAKTLLDGGVDGFIIETMSAIDEVTIAIEAVKSVCELPVFAAMAFDKVRGDFRTMMGVDVETAVSAIILLGVDAVGFNCGKVPLDDYVGLADRYVSVARDLNQESIICAEPNAGLPELVEDKVVYKVTPKEFTAVVKNIYSTGVTVLGGCCGTGPEHIQTIADKLKNV